MSWLFSVKRYRSEKNGIIVCRKLFGVWSVFVETYDQSSPYIKNMWRGALKRFPSTKPTHKILLLGLGAGSIVDDLYNKYPAAVLTVIEYDPVMVEVAQALKLFKRTPQIIVDDAVHAVPNLPGEFDLIIVDLYRGKKTSPILEQASFLQSLSTKLAPNGRLVLNVFENAFLFPIFDKLFTQIDRWKSEYNELAIYASKPIDDALENIN